MSHYGVVFSWILLLIVLMLFSLKYRVLNFNKADNNVWANTPLIIGQTAKEQFAEVEANVPVFNLWNVEVKKGNEFLEEKKCDLYRSQFYQYF